MARFTWDFARDLVLLAVRRVVERDFVPLDEDLALLALFEREPLELRFVLAVLRRAELPFELEPRDFPLELRGLVLA